MSHRAKPSSIPTPPGGGEGALPGSGGADPKGGQEPPKDVSPTGTPEVPGDGKPTAAPEAEAAPKKPRRLRIPKASELKNPAQLSEADDLFIAEATYQRELLGCSQEELADQLKVRRGAVQHYERRRRGLSLWMTFAIAKIMGFSIDDMINAGREKKLSPDYKHLFPQQPE